jgi:hypothetical protein
MESSKRKNSETNCIKFQGVVVGNELIGLPDVSMVHGGCTYRSDMLGHALTLSFSSPLALPESRERVLTRCLDIVRRSRSEVRNLIVINGGDEPNSRVANGREDHKVFPALSYSGALLAES